MESETPYSNKAERSPAIQGLTISEAGCSLRGDDQKDEKDWRVGGKGSVGEFVALRSGGEDSLGSEGDGSSLLV